MPGTRSSARNADKSPSPAKSDDAVAGTKRKPDAEPSPNRGHKATKKQATIEETMGAKQEEDSEMRDAADSEQEQDAKETDQSKEKPDQEQAQSKEVKAQVDSTKEEEDVKEHETNGDAKEYRTINDAKEDKTDSDEKSSVANGDGPIEKSSQRAKEVPSNILEKGIIYFFTRNRVGIEDADSVADLQRTFFVLRPMPIGAKLGDGALADQKNNRLLALPKKAFPKSHTDRFMAFVEKANTTVQDLKENFFAANEYETKTQGTRRTEPITPVAEGVYAITRTEDATTHLVYSTTIPAELGEVQEDLGIKTQGSFIISVKNPERSGPAAAQLPQKPDFPKEIIEEFRNLAWSEVMPKYLDYEYCQILLIGENIDKAVEPTKKDQKHDKETPQEELEKLEHEDELRIQHLHGDDSVFDDLKISKNEYPKVPTTCIDNVVHHVIARPRSFVCFLPGSMIPSIVSTTEEHQCITWSLQSFAVGHDFKSPGPAVLLLDRANSEFGITYQTAPGLMELAQFPDTDEPVYFQVLSARAACTRLNTTCKKVCVLMQHFQLDLVFTTPDSAADFLQTLGRLATKVGNLYFEVYEAPSNSALTRADFSMEKQGFANQMMQPWMALPYANTSDWGRIYSTGKCSDFTIIAESRSFPVHRVFIQTQYTITVLRCGLQWKVHKQRSIKLPETEDTVATMLQELYGVYNPTTGSIFTNFALRRGLEKDHIMSNLMALFVACDKYNLESIKRKAAEAIIDRLPFVHDTLSIVDLAGCLHDEQYPHIDLGLRKSAIKLLHARLPGIMEDEDAWKEFSDNKILLKAFHAYQCEMTDNGSSTGVLTPPATPTKK
ncbi:Nn.00g111400.m01.CDS01 [Neocucurbitaria sp. VM-36]